MINRIALYHIETLLWISRLGTFNAAAERLNTTQPSVSARMRELENHLGTPLFRREGRRMLLTVKGREFVQQCELLWGQIEDVLLRAGALSAATGIVRIGCGEIVAIRSLPRFLAEIKTLMPNVTLEVDVDLSIHLRNRLEAGSLDLAILVGPVDSPALEHESLGTYEMSWFVNRSFADRVEADGRDAIPVWCLSRPSHLYHVTTELFRNANLKRPINTCNRVSTLIDTVSQSGGMAILPDLLVRQEIESATLMRVPGMPDPERINFHTVIRREEKEPVVRELFARSTQLRVEDS